MSLIGRILRTAALASGAVLVLTGRAGVRAADTPDLAAPLAAIENEYHRGASDLRAACHKSKDWSGFAAACERLRQAAAAKLEALVAKHGPGGEGPAAEVGRVYEVLLSPGIAPPGGAAWALARRLLSADPGTASAWSICCELHDGVELAAYREESKPSWSPLQKWAAEFRADPAAQGETRLALDLLLARLALDQGVNGQARRLADQVVLDGGGQLSLRDAARRIRGRSTLRAAGIEAAPFRLPGARDGDVALADLRGRVVALLFSFDDDEERMLRAAVMRVCLDLTPDDFAFVSVPLATPSASWSPGPGEVVARYGDLARKVGDAYGVLDVSAMFLVGPTGAILRSQGWDSPTASEEALTLARAALGAPLPELLKAVAAERSWAAFPAAWRRVFERRRGDFDGSTWEAARAAGPRAVYALLLAACAAGRKPEAGAAADTSSLHGRIVAAFVSHRFGDGDEAWKKLVLPLQTKSDVEGLLDVVDALFDLGIAGDDVRLPLEQAAVKGKDWRLVATALRAIARQETDSAPPRPVAARAKDKVWQVRLAAAEALRAYRHPDSIAPLVELLGDERQRVRCEAAATLRALTREDFGVSQKAWTAWRRAQGQEIELPPRELNSATLARSSGHDYAVSTYFGAKVASDRVVLVLDKSETMYYSLFDTGVDEVRAFLEGAGPTMSFNVIQFAEVPQSFRKKLVPANASNVAAAVEFLTRDKPYGPTNVSGALREALAVEDVDTIVYLSDGEPANRGTPTEPAAMLDLVAAANRYLRVTVHCLWMTPGRLFPHDGPRGKDKPPLDDAERARRKDIRERAAEYSTTCVFLQALAAAHGGTFGVAFGDQYQSPPGAATRPSTDK